MNLNCIHCSIAPQGPRTFLSDPPGKRKGEFFTRRLPCPLAAGGQRRESGIALRPQSPPERSHLSLPERAPRKPAQLSLPSKPKRRARISSQQMKATPLKPVRTKQREFSLLIWLEQIELCFSKRVFRTAKRRF